MGDNQYSYRDANRNQGYLGGIPQSSTPPPRRSLNASSGSSSHGAPPVRIPWQPFLGVAFAVVGIVILSSAAAMLRKGQRRPTYPPDNTAAYAGVTSPGSTVDDDLSVTPDETPSSAVPVNVEKADFTGTWHKTDVYENQKATITVTDQNDMSFQFTLKLWNGKKTATISGEANFTDTDAAAYLQGAGVLYFQRGTQYMSVFHSGSNADFGIADGFQIDGKFTDGTPSYYTKQETKGYDYQLYQSDRIVKALSATLSKDDYALYQEMMKDGLQSPIAYERKVDKNGNKVNVDAELDCVKYYAHLNSIGKDMIFICSDSGKIYVLFYDVEEMRYYTNDKSYSTKMPKAFQAVADAKQIEPLMIYR
ncbi:MAG: hypothetical protein IIZ68_11005 [Clostridia bacterium]|nr:hypothetical protein [Clostridia bacterium]